MKSLGFLAVICLLGVRGQQNPICLSTAKCPNRAAIEAILDQPNIDFFNNLFLNPTFALDFAPGPEGFDKLLTDVQSQGTGVQGIDETFAELLGSFLSSLREGCNIVIGSDLESAITASFDAQFETLVATFITAGGAVGLCPSRSAVKAITDQAISSGFIDVLSITNNPAFSVAFGGLATIIASLSTTDVKVVVEDFQTFLDDFIDALEENCFIPVRDELRSLITESFDAAIEARVALLTPPPDCPNRQAIITAVQNNNVAAILANSEFSTLTQRLNTLDTDLNAGSIAEVKNIFERLNEIENSLLSILMDSCFIIVRDDLEQAIAEFFFNRGEALAASFLNGGGPDISECPNRQAIVSAIQSGASLSTFLALPEFAKVQEELDKLNEPISGVSVVIEQVNKARSAFDEVLRSNCLIDDPNFFSACLFDSLVDEFCAGLDG